ncbi:MAG: hypothetical protein IH872_02185 [Chloroflexi bacterium]|nr:hypothetical protein [Chloroflexota bacterium]
MLENSLREEKVTLEDLISKLQPIVDEFMSVEVRLQHINALLGIGPPENGTNGQPRINWAKLCRENGLRLQGDSGHRVLKRLKSQVHDAIQHVCDL